MNYLLGLVGLVVVAFLLRFGVRLIADMMVAGNASWVPIFGTPGVTITIYYWIVALFTLVLVPVAAFWLGAKYGRQTG
jgi:hypothetical protein